MGQKKAEKLFKTIEKLSTAKKEDKTRINIIRASDLADIEFIKTGIEPFDSVVGGFPRGRFSLVYGGTGVGKTTLELMTCGKCIREDLAPLIMEPENRAEKKYWAKYVNLDLLPLSQATSLGDTLDSLVRIIETGDVDIVFVDSLASLAVKELRGKGTEGDHMALVARRLPQFFQMSVEAVEKSQTAVVLLHQKRDVMDMYSSELETYGGGNALKHHVSLILNMRRASTTKDPDKGERFVSTGSSKSKLGFMTNIKCIKGTVGSIKEGTSVQLDYMYDQGFVNSSSIAMYAMRNKIIAKDGPANYVFNSYRQRGLQNVINDITTNADLRGEILKAVQDAAWNDSPTAEVVSPDMEFEHKQMLEEIQMQKELENAKPQTEEENTPEEEPSVTSKEEKVQPPKKRGRKPKGGRA